MSKLILLLSRNTLSSYTFTDWGLSLNWGALQVKMMTNQSQPISQTPDLDCLIDEDVGLPHHLDVLSIIDENIALVGRLRPIARVLAGVLGQGVQKRRCHVVLHTFVLPIEPGDVN